MRKILINCPARRAVVVSAVLLAIGTSIAPAGATPADDAGKRSLAPASVQPAAPVPAGFETWAETFAMQDRLNAAAEKIVATRGDGYAGIIAAPTNRELIVYWKGEVSQTLREFAGGLGVPVRFRPATFTERELLAETSRLATDPEVRSVGPEVDGSGLTITVTGAGLAAIRSGAGTVGTAKVPLRVQRESAPEPLFNRQNDIAPYFGGARYTTPVGGCSTGFAILWGGSSRMLSAGHCGNNGQTAIDGGGNPAVDTMGVIINDNNARDNLMINTRSGGAIFTRGPRSGSSVNVIGATADFVGNLVCTGGARTGEHCNIAVTHVNQVAIGSFPLTRGELVAGCAAARGDSGGPVYHYSGAGVTGRGTISAGVLDTADCSPHAPKEHSSRIVWWAPLLRPVGGSPMGSLQFYGATIR
ncbi:S1 family peptidase [Kibdelosporangium philippinense]|uniref:S1 family peptidase n=1 Tax=Kibdelosporangium philippinense TaxID=211113 RepID=A0ABS8Z8N9_9PSEU|nr:S1 family peptidase [Kibdelosporangium philippinense]MCE7002217.1 S1 family peptidase [Kibdelosporangium philippinense]